jgi:hypothetical protein
MNQKKALYGLNILIKSSNFDKMAKENLHLLN